MYQNNYKSKNINSIKIYLIEQSTWLPWISLVEVKATRGSIENVWKYIDPSRITQPELPASPRIPQPCEIKSIALSILHFVGVLLYY